MRAEIAAFLDSSLGVAVAVSDFLFECLSAKAVFEPIIAHQPAPQ